MLLQPKVFFCLLVCFLSVSYLHQSGNLRWKNFHILSFYFFFCCCQMGISKLAHSVSHNTVQGIMAMCFFKIKAVRAQQKVTQWCSGSAVKMSGFVLRICRFSNAML